MCKPLELAEKVENSRYVSDNLKEVVMYKGRGFGKILVETLLDNYLIVKYSGSQAGQSPGKPKRAFQGAKTSSFNACSGLLTLSSGQSSSFSGPENKTELAKISLSTYLP